MGRRAIGMSGLLVAAAASGWAASGWASSVGAGPAPEQSASALYVERCAGCHDNPHDRIPPRANLEALSPDAIVATLTMGAMRRQAEGLGPADIAAIAQYLGGGRAVSRHPVNRCSTTIAAADPAAPDWNGWGFDDRNTRYQPDPGIAAADVPRLRIKWAYAYPGDEPVSIPVVVGKTLFVGSGAGRIFALDADTGCTFWTRDVGAPVKAALTLGRLGSDENAPVAAFFGALDGNLYALDAADGRIIWKVQVGDHPTAQLRGSVKLLDGILYVPISSTEETAAADPGYPCCTFRGGLVAVDARTGAIVWRTHTIPDAPRPTGRNPAGAQNFGPAGAAIWNSPTLDKKRGRLYVGTGNSYSPVETPYTDAIMAFDMKTGRPIWTTQSLPRDVWILCMTLGEGNCPKDIGPDFDFGSSTVLVTLSGNREVLLAGQKSGMVFALDPDDGNILWRRQVGVGGAYGGIEHGITAAGDVVYVPSSDLIPRAVVPADQLKPHAAGGLTALDATSGKQLWRTPPPDPVCGWGADPCVAAQAAAPASIPGIVFSGSLDGHMRAYAMRDGKIVWDFDTARDFPAVNGGVAKGGSITGYGETIADGTLFVHSGGGYFGPPGNALLAFTVDGK